MTQSWTFKVYARILYNPIEYNASHKIDINLINRVGIFELHKEDVEGQISYKIEVLKPSALGVEDNNRMKMHLVNRELILACNLTLKEVALTENLNTNKLTLPSQSDPAQVKVTKTSHSIEAQIGTKGKLSSDFNLTIDYKEDIDESEVIDKVINLKRLNSFDMNSPSSFYLRNLKKAFHKYKTAMNDLDSLSVFQNLYNTLEFITNINGEKAKDENLDRKMALFIGATEGECRKWRLFYNRTKHPDRNEKDVETWISGTEDLNDYIKRIRPLAAGGLMKRLFFSPVISQYQPHNL